MFHDFIETVKHWFDWAAFSVGLAVFFQWLPAVTGLASLVWLAMRMYETYLSVQIKKGVLNGNIRNSGLDPES